MPPIAIAAGIGAVGAIGGSLINKSATNKVVQQQQAAADQQIANANQNRDYQYSLNAPTIAQGNRAGDLQAGFLGAGGDANASADALNTFRNSIGYQDLLKQGDRTVNAAVYARGGGDSGMALKALQDRALQTANGTSQQWFGNLGTLADRGAQGRGLVAGVGLNTVNMNNNSIGNAADASSNATLSGTANTNSLIQGLLNAGAAAYGSSYQNQQKPAAQSYAPAPDWNNWKVGI